MRHSAPLRKGCGVSVVLGSGEESENGGSAVRVRLDRCHAERQEVVEADESREEVSGHVRVGEERFLLEVVTELSEVEQVIEVGAGLAGLIVGVLLGAHGMSPKSLCERLFRPHVSSMARTTDIHNPCDHFGAGHFRKCW
jgi:hypothetical protein